MSASISLNDPGPGVFPATTTSNGLPEEPTAGPGGPLASGSVSASSTAYQLQPHRHISKFDSDTHPEAVHTSLDPKTKLLTSMKYTECAVLAERPISTNQTFQSGGLAMCDRSVQCMQQSTLSNLGPAHELSISLPNLTATFDALVLNSVNKTHVRNSLSDICNQGRGADVRRKLATDLPNARQLHIKTMSLEDCLSCCQEGGLGKCAHSPRLIAAGYPVTEDATLDLAVSVTPNNNRLSAVLENIPLLYLPHTKQLISVKNPELASSSSTSGAVKGMVVPHDPQSETNAARTSDSDQTETEGKENQSNPGEDSHDMHDDHPVSSALGQQIASSSQAQNSAQHCPLLQSGSGSGVALSPDSERGSSLLDASPQSQVKTTSSAPTEECDEASINELTKLNDSPRSTLDRISTAESLTRTDASSFSSISSLSTGTDLSASVAEDFADLKGTSNQDNNQGSTESEDGCFVEVNLSSSRNSFERSRDGSQDSGIDERLSLPLPHQCVKTKRKGITSFLTRNLFWRKAKEQSADSSAPGWKLFGKVPPKHSPNPRDPEEISQDFKARTQVTLSQGACPGRPRDTPTETSEGLQFCRNKKVDVEVSSTTALILEPRPVGLPSKDPKEELRHKQQYEAMVEGARKREQREAKQRKRQLQQQLKHEEAMSAAVKVWNVEILANWETMKTGKKTRDLWWSGIPPAVRGKVWKLAFGNDLNLTPELYEICLNRARERLKLMREQCAGSDTDSISSFSSFTLSEPPSSKESSVELIKLDVSRTFPQLCIFQKGGPYHDLLQGLLGAYVCYRPDVGYVQGMSFIAAVLLLNMDVADAFICFANLLNRPCQVAFFRLDEILMKSYFETYEELFEENLPKLYEHFTKQALTPDLYIIDWMFTLYAKSLPLDVASRVWDVFCRDGEEFLFRTALGILQLYEEILLNMDFIHLAQFLTRLPENISGDDIFQYIEGIHMNIDKRSFQQVLASHREVKDT